MFRRQRQPGSRDRRRRSGRSPSHVAEQSTTQPTGDAAVDGSRANGVVRTFGWRLRLLDHSGSAGRPGTVHGPFVVEAHNLEDHLAALRMASHGDLRRTLHSELELGRAKYSGLSVGGHEGIVELENCSRRACPTALNWSSHHVPRRCPCAFPPLGYHHPEPAGF